MNQRDFVRTNLLPIIIGLDPAEVLRETSRRQSHEAVPASQRSGTVVSRPYEGGPEVQADTLTCAHCGFTWIPAPGSGRRRGFCMRCNGVCCGRACCERTGCIPGGQERIVENIEKGLPTFHVPISVSVPQKILLG